MKLYNDSMLVHGNVIIDIVRRSLSKIDPRLIEHGERVGFIASKIYEELDENDKKELDFQKLFVLCILHDIGAYKTNEIDDMVIFETERPFDHSLFGYLFLKNTTHLKECAESILYHHTNYDKLKNMNCKYDKYAELIHIADRVDILFETRIAQKSRLGNDLEAIKKLSGTQFNPLFVEALLRAEEKNHIYDNMQSKRFIDKVHDVINNLNIATSSIMQYLKLLVYAIDFRSPYTVTHTADTTIISLETGKLLGLDEQELQKLYFGAFLHDIGKIAIPNSILEKPGKLTADEYKIVQSHIVEGENILRGVISDEICDIALHHHEKIDGSGYAKGLTGDKLTLSQKIVAVADIFSALSQRRSYKEPFDKELVLSILNKMKRERKLDALVVDTVNDNYDLILENAEKSHDPVRMMYMSLIDEYEALSKSF